MSSNKTFAKIITFCLISLSNNLFAQQKTTELTQFINSFIENQVPADFKHFNLVDSSIVRNTFPVNEYLKGINIDFPSFPINDFVTDKLEILDWKNFKLDKARIYTKQTIPKFYAQATITILVSNQLPKAEIEKKNKEKKYYETIVPVDLSWSKERKDEEINKIREQNNAAIAKEDKIAFRFSNPIFSNNKNYAIIFMDTDEKGMLFAYQKVNNKWVQVYKMRTWIV